MGVNQKLLFGKSFYGDDIGFAGYLDNIAYYPYPLSEEEITGGSVPPRIKGDLSADGTVNMDDVNAMVSFLTAAKAPADWKAGDLNEDGRLNAIDLTLLKRILLYQSA